MTVVGIRKKSVSVIEKNHLNQCLSASEFRQYQPLGTSQRRDWLAGRMALKGAFIADSAVPDIGFKSLVVDNHSTGQPYFVGYDKLFCSLGHSNAWGVGAVSAQPLGVDIEEIRPHTEEALSYISDPQEVEELREAREPTADLVTRIWTLKEAVMKGLGVGLNISPKQLRIRRSDSIPFMVEVLQVERSEIPRVGDAPPPEVNAPLWKAFTYKVEPFFISVACCAEEIHETPAIYWYHSTFI